MNSKNNIYECTRCGLCCFTGPCREGNEESLIGLGCSKLRLHSDGITSCILLATDKVKPEDIGITGCGCILKHYPEWYKENLIILNTIKQKEFNIKYLNPKINPIL